MYVYLQLLHSSVSRQKIPDSVTHLQQIKIAFCKTGASFMCKNCTSLKIYLLKIISGLKSVSLSCHIEDTCRLGVHYTCTLKYLLEKRNRFYCCFFSCYPNCDFQDPFHLYLHNACYLLQLFYTEFHLQCSRYCTGMTDQSVGCLCSGMTSYWFFCYLEL